MESNAKGPVVAIGNFDGVHRGHTVLLAAAKRIAAFENRELVVLTFEPHPRTYFKPDGEPFRITPEHVKERRLKVLGVDRVEILDFNNIMAGLSPQQFIDFMIIDHLNASHVIVGVDFHFGKNRAGHVDTLQADPRFQTTAVPLDEDSGEAISSTRIRDCLKAGDIKSANILLGWGWEIEGTVIHGDKRGRDLGYPTANIPMDDTVVPAYGVYAAQIFIGDAWHPAAINIGIRPMFEVKTPMLEAYVLDFAGDLYDQTLRVRPIQKLRDEAKFGTVDALKNQMAQDVKDVEKLIKSQI